MIQLSSPCVFLWRRNAQDLIYKYGESRFSSLHFSIGYGHQKVWICEKLLFAANLITKFNHFCHSLNQSRLETGVGHSMVYLKIRTTQFKIIGSHELRGLNRKWLDKQWICLVWQFNFWYWRLQIKLSWKLQISDLRQFVFAPDFNHSSDTNNGVDWIHKIVTLYYTV